MALEEIFSRILADAKCEAGNIIDNALKEKNSIIQEIEKEANLLRQDIIARARSDGEFAYRKEVIDKKLKAQKAILQAKRSQLDNCFQEAEDSLF